MKIKRLCAANIREAMRKIREELGPDAVILSNQRTAAGFEIVAAIDYDEQTLQQATLEAAAQRRALAREIEEQPGRDPEDDKPSIAADQLFDPAIQQATAVPESDQLATCTSQERAAPARLDKSRVVWAQDPLLVEMRNEIQVMHNLLEQQLSGLAWGELARQQPHRADLLSQLLDFGFNPHLCLRLAEAAANERHPERAWRLALETLGRSLTVTEDDILTQGGVVALVGPTGVGKTTTIAKLAARYNLRHGPHHVALVTTDSYRIGAFEQLCTFGVIMDAPVKLVRTARELRDAITGFSDKSLILIDTAGMGQRDLRLSQQFALLKDAPQVRNYLVLAANALHAVLRETVTAFGCAPLSGAILTKVDETTRLGAALSAVHEKRLPLAYIGNGQRVPEDLLVARIDALIRMGEEFAGLYSEPAERDTLALTFGKRLAAHAC
ncbi:MAG TPA: flagellar biosynthesis protein FlhF [Candidatus Competibacteraceae bacterium]|nr:flagellar biosynthesis protein FlhF [Candidatus Competibacteraceae bacterium]MCP5133981.1 flagellar biosynthesis protein FlhF [Gammaproteobacteria bacterium]HPF59094.1 flagellar biosynthesis protein FlhF [Candidatus Competibacteraceae bacterium]HRY19604.1 flagellar biosynthesis protein FlhF [Candidatus Competibacteraceae bacterium]